MITPNTEIPNGTTRLYYHGYIDPHLVHALKKEQQTAVVGDRHFLDVDGIGETGLKLRFDSNPPFSIGDTVTVSLWNGLFLCEPGAAHTNTPHEQTDITCSPGVNPTVQHGNDNTSTVVD